MVFKKKMKYLKKKLQKTIKLSSYQKTMHQKMKKYSIYNKKVKKLKHKKKRLRRLLQKKLLQKPLKINQKINKNEKGIVVMWIILVA